MRYKDESEREREKERKKMRAEGERARKRENVSYIIDEGERDTEIGVGRETRKNTQR